MFSCLAALDTKVYRPFCILQARLPAGSGEIHRGCRATRAASPQALYGTPPAGEAARTLDGSRPAGGLRRRPARCRRPPQAACWRIQALGEAARSLDGSQPAGAFVEPAQPAAAWRVGRLNSLSWIDEFAFVEPAQPYGASVKLTETLVLEFEFKLSGLPKLITDSLILESLQPL